jgi:hypothetical protein
MERPWVLENSTEGGGIETCNPNSESSGDGNFLLACMAMEEIAAFSFCDYKENGVGMRSIS